MAEPIINGFAGIIKKLRDRIEYSGAGFLIVLPSYNEAENIGEIINRIRVEVKVPAEILVIDDDSPDGTAVKVRGLMKDNLNLHLLINKQRAGLGAAYIIGFKAGIGAGFNYIVTMDSDLSHPPEAINRMAAEIINSDIVIGSRFTEGGGTVDFPLWRVILSRWGNFLIRLLLGMKVMDCTSGYRCYRSGVLADINFDNDIHSKKYAFLIEILFLIKSKKCRIWEIPISYINRVRGKSKINIFEILNALRVIAGIYILSLFRRTAGRQ